jgi:2-polyprenyl-3-methyl-5-hydroxy-6-metoxy-1,4-benzoquinol methylase
MKTQYELKPLNGSDGKIYVGIPRERIYIPAFVDNRDSLLMYLQDSKRGVGYYQAEGHRVDRNRDKITKEFMELDDKPEWLVMIDTDMQHPRTAPERLVAHNQPIVGALYFHRGQTHDPFVFRKVDGYPDRWGREGRHWAPYRDEVYSFLMANGVPLKDAALVIDGAVGDIPALFPCDAVATGCMAVHRSVFETMERPWWEYRQGGNSEDLIFCDEAKFDYGIPIHADLSTICGHYNWVPMGHAQFRSLYEARGVNLTTYSKRMAATWLSEYEGLEFEEAVQRIESGNAHMTGDYWKVKYKKKAIEKFTPKMIKDFYNDSYVGYLYLIELLHWNFSQTFSNFRRNLMGIRGGNVLEIGAGIGTVAMQLAIQLNEVVASETNEYLRKFIAYRWQGIQKEIESKHGELFLVDQEWRETAEDEQFGAVVAIDVFEHLPEAYLKDMIKDIYRVLPIGGSLVYHANFGQQDLYPQHYDYNEWWGDYLVEQGFVHTTPFEAVKTR